MAWKALLTTMFLDNTEQLTHTKRQKTQDKHKPATKIYAKTSSGINRNKKEPVAMPSHA